MNPEPPAQSHGPGGQRPKTVLAIELSTPCGQVAVVRGGEVLFEESFTSERSHNSRLYDPLGRALDAASGALDLIAVGTGPGQG